MPCSIATRPRSARSYALNLSGSRYFTERAPIADYEDLDRRMRSGELSLAHRNPPGFGRDVLRGPERADRRLDRRRHAAARRDRPGLRQGMHQHWLPVQAASAAAASAAGQCERRDALSLQPRRQEPAGHGAGGDPLLLLMLPAMLTALAVVREKETGSIINLYVTPVTRTEFLLGKQLPYVAAGHAELPADVRCSRSPSSACRSGQLLPPCRWPRCCLLLRRHRHGAAGLGRHAQPDCGHVLRHDRHHHSGHRSSPA
jgi:hypothetical protein